MRFIGEEVEVRFLEKSGPPSSFVWRGKEYRICEILEYQRTLDFQRHWRLRRHRDHYLVRTEEGSTFELYFHRGPGRRYWVLTREF